MESFTGFLKKNSDIMVAGLIIGIILMIIIPLSPGLLDILLVFSITLGLLVLLITMFTTEPLQFSIFPSLLLVATLYRLALNISSTRLILNEAEAGKVIEAFGNFVIGGNFVVGLVVFIIITLIQFVVITSGAGRVAEVSARFTLDAMPGKQMSIDAEFNSGLITETEAREKRKRMQGEADFFGSMDGASKFVRGDAIAGILIILINIIGGIIIGVVQHGMPAAEALKTYALLTVGDGLVTQVPALLVSTASGILITRAASDFSFGKDLSLQFLAFPRAILVASFVLFLLGLVPAMPNTLFLMMSAGLGFTGYYLGREEKRKIGLELRVAEEKASPKHQEPENVASYFYVDLLEVEIGYGLVSMTDEASGGDLLKRLAAVRRQCASELGIFVRPIRIRDNLRLKPDDYSFKIKGVEVAAGTLMPGHSLAMNPTGEEMFIKGISTTEPTFGLPAWWISEENREEAEISALTVVDCSTVLITHLTEVIKKHSHELLGVQEVKELLDLVKEKNPVVVGDLYPEKLTLTEIQKVLQGLLKERVPVRDMVSILESLSDGSRFNRDIDYLIEHVRQGMARLISRQHIGQGGSLNAVTLHPKLEQTIIDSIQMTQMGNYPMLEPSLTVKLIENLQSFWEKLNQYGNSPVVICSTRIRLPFRRLTERYLPGMAVLSVNEIAQDVDVKIVGTVTAD